MIQHSFAKRLLYKAEIAVALVIAKGMVAFLPFATLRRFWGNVGETNEATMATEATAEQRHLGLLIGRYIKETEARLPFEVVCLPQAIAGRWMLRKRGVESRIVVGAKKTQDDDSLEFHAWLMVGSTCVLGGAGSKGFEPFQATVSIQKET